MPRRKLAALAAAACALLACGAQSGGRAPAPPRPGLTETPAADLRARLDCLLGEQTLLAAKAAGADLGGRADQLAAYREQLDESGRELGEVVGGAGLPSDTGTRLASQHVLRARQAVDDQAKKDWARAYADVRAEYTRARTTGDALAATVMNGNPKRFPGDVGAAAVDLRVTLDLLLEEHLYLATAAADAVVSGRADELQGATSALNDNAADLARAVGGVYGPGAQEAFSRIWSSHNVFFLNYTTSVARRDPAGQSKAVSDLTGTYIPQFAAFLAGATGLPEDALAMRAKQQVLTAKDVVDAEAARNYREAARKDRTAAEHMEMLGDQIAAASARARRP
jgi:hypothetical protein